MADVSPKSRPSMSGLSGLSDPTSGSFQSAKSQSAPLSMPRLPSQANLPSTPRQVSRGSLAAFESGVERPVRLQLTVAFVLLLMAVAIPLYLWRRPRALPEQAAQAKVAASLDAYDNPSAAAPSRDLGTVLVGDGKTLSCGDGAGKRSASAPPCDRLVELERALGAAITESATCVPREAGGGAIPYVLDVNFKKRTVALTTPKDGRTFKDPNVTAACQAAVKAKLPTTVLEGLGHQHARYRISVSATYPGPVKL